MIRILHESDAVKKPWKNGRGVTTEIAISPPGADFARGEFDWRVSRATIVEDGPFSSFPDHDRVLVLLDGAGIEVTHGNAAPVALHSLVPHRFRGDVATRARLFAGPVSDFNVFVARGRFDAELEILHDGERPIASGVGVSLLCVVRGSLVATIDPGSPIRLTTNDTLRIDDPRDGTALRTAGTGVAVLVRIHRVTF